MLRDLKALSEQTFDLVVVGGGIQGACVAREASLNGLKVALIEKGDFCGATSHHSLKLIHGGIRYLQQFDFPRILESIQERRFWLRAAPHLVRPLQAIVPTYGQGMRGRNAFRIATLIYNTLGLRANDGVPKDRRIGLAHTISRDELIKLLPDAAEASVSGGAVWYDGQMKHADRVVLECVQQTADNGGSCANYLKAAKVQVKQGRVTGLEAICQLTNERLLIKTPIIVNASGPWLMELPKQTLNDHNDFPQSFNLNVVLKWAPKPYAFALQSSQLADSKVGEAKRLLFFTPWENVTVAGTSHTPYFGDINDPVAEIEKIRDNFLAEVNSAVKSRQFTMDDVVYTYWGFTPGDENSKGSGRALKSEIIDHSADGQQGLFSVAGVKFTTARNMAEKVLKKVGALIEKPLQGYQDIPTPGGKGYTGSATLKQQLMKAFPGKERAINHLVDYFGTQAERVLKEPMELDGPECEVLGEGVARHVIYSARHEMVQKLEDCLVRRYSGVQGGRVDEKIIEAVAYLVARELGWSEDKKRSEIAGFKTEFPA